MRPGKVWLVGAGPGDPGLITVRGREVLEQADVVLFDALAHPELLTLCPGAERLFVGKRYGQDSVPQPEITARLIELARAGKRVVRLKGGDPFLFARGSEEAEALAEAGVPFEVVPGITSPAAASAYAGVSLTHRDWSSSVTFITGHQRAGVEWSPEQWRKLATATDTLCVLMGMKRIDAIVSAILEGGRGAETPALAIQWGTRSDQRVVTAPLAELPAAVRAAGLANPAVIVIGEVARLRDRLRWFDSRPLFGRRLFIPRALEQSAETARAVRERGAEPVVIPLIRIVPPDDAARLSAAVATLATRSWVVFTSANGVRACFAELDRQSRDARAFGGARVAAIGPRTAAALAARGVRADVVAGEFVGEALARDLLAALEEEPVGARGSVLLLRAAVARDALPDALRAAGLEVDVVPAYQTLPADEAAAADLRGRLRAGTLDVLLFTASSTVESTAAALGADLDALTAGRVVACIGPVTAATARRLGFHVDVVASEYTVEGLLDALEAHLGASDGGVGQPGAATAKT